MTTPMESTLARVISVSHETALVSIDTAAACPRCASGNGCGAGILGGSARNRRLEVPVAPGVEIVSGDHVRLSLKSHHLLRAAVLAYLLPLAGIVLSLAAATWLFEALSDGQAALIAVAGFAVGLLIGRRLLQQNTCLDRLVPSVTERVAPSETRFSSDAA